MTVYPSVRLTAMTMALLDMAVIAGNIVYYFNYGEFNIPLLVVPLLLVSLYNVPKLIALRSTRLTIKDGAIRYESGLLAKTTRTMELTKVQDVRVDQTLTQRMMGLGDITIETAGESSRITMHGIERPHDVASSILAAARGGQRTRV